MIMCLHSEFPMTTRREKLYNPKPVKEAYELDEENNNNLWRKGIEEDM